MSLCAVFHSINNGPMAAAQRTICVPQPEDFMHLSQVLSSAWASLSSMSFIIFNVRLGSCRANSMVDSHREHRRIWVVVVTWRGIPLPGASSLGTVITSLVCLLRLLSQTRWFQIAHGYQMSCLLEGSSWSELSVGVL